MTKPKVNWRSLDREWPTVAGWCWVTRNNGKNIELCKYDPEDNLRFYNVTYWAKVEYPEPPEEEKKVSELEKWRAEACSSIREELIAVLTARKLIEVMEERGYDHPHRAAGIDYNQGYIDGRQETINYIKRWCEEE